MISNGRILCKLTTTLTRILSAVMSKSRTNSVLLTDLSTKGLHSLVGARRKSAAEVRFVRHQLTIAAKVKTAQCLNAVDNPLAR